MLKDIKLWKFALTIGLLLLCGRPFYAQIGPPKLIDPTIKVPKDALFEDLNYDGHSDIIIVSQERISLFFWEDGDYISRPLAGGEGGFAEVHFTDINNDGYKDILTARILSDEVVWFPNDGDGIFGNPQVAFSGVGAALATGALINDDEFIDVVYKSGTEVFYRLGNGTGLFFGNTLIVDNINQNSVKVADLDGDGAADLIGPSTSTNDISIWWNDGFGGFTEQVVTIGLSSVNRVTIGDMNDDALLDVVVVAGQLQVYVVPNLGGQSFGPANAVATVTTASPCLLENVVGDELPDLLVSFSETDDIVAFENMGDFNFGSGMIMDNPEYPAGICLDVNHEDATTTMLYTWDGGTSVVQGFESYEFETARALGFATEIATWLQYEDADADGNLDIVGVADDGIWILYGLGNDEYERAERLSDFVPNSGRMHVGDIDGNGYPDVAYSDILGGQVNVIYQDDFRQWSDDQLFTSLITPNFIVIGDANGDGINDVCINNGTDEFHFFRGDGLGVFTQQSYSFIDEDFTRFLLHDGDNDGDKDLYLYGSSAVYVSEMNLSVFDSDPDMVASIPGTALWMSIADFTGDGIDDIVQTDFDLTTLYFHAGLGGLNYESITLEETVNQSRYSQPLDLDNNGLMDILVAQSDGAMIWLKNTGQLNFEHIQMPYVLPYGSIFYKGDMDADGDMDILSSPYVAPYASVSENFANGPYQFQGYCFVDFDGNGIEDGEDIPFPWMTLRIQQLESYFYSGLDGNFTTYSDAGAYTLVPEFDETLFQISTAQTAYNAILDEDNPVSIGNDFGFEPTGWQEEINGEFVTQSPRCLEEVVHWLSVGNQGNTIPSGVVAYEIDELCTFVNSQPLPDSTDGNILYYSYEDLFYFDQAEFEVEVLMPEPEIPMPWMTHYMTTYAEDELGELYVVDVDSLTQQLLCGYDPNDKMEEIGYTAELFITPDDTMEYTIRFQNTGNDTVFCCMIRDDLPPYVERGSLKPIQWSHSFDFYIEQDGEAVFVFDNINLPDSAHDLLGSQGYVKFTAAFEEGIEDGTKIYNTVNIYFDQNPPITTNTVVNEIYDCDVGIELIVNETVFCLGDTLEAAHGYKGLSDIEWQFDLYGGSDTIFCTALNDPGDFYLFLNSEDPLCGSRSDSILIMVNALGSPALMTEPEPLCEGQTTELVSEAFENNEWYLADALLGTEQTLEIDEGGEYLLRINNDGCLSEFVSIEVEELEAPVASITALETVICENESTVLLSNEWPTIVWTYNDEQVGDEILLEVSDPGYYVLSVHDGMCASLPDSVLIATLSLPEVEILGEDWFCAGDSTLLWTADESEATWTIDDVIYTSAHLHISTSTLVQVETFDGTCYSDPIFIDVEATPLPIATVDQQEFSFCPGTEVWLEAGAFDQYFWYEAITFYQFGDDDDYMIDTPGTYWLWVVEDGCESEILEIVATEYDAPPTPNIIVQDSSFVCSVNGPNYSYYWYYYEQWLEDETEHTMVPSAYGDYRVEIEDENGCVAASEVVSFDIGIRNPIDLDILIIPNPVHDRALVQLPNGFEALLGLYDARGKKVYEATTNGSHVLDLSAYESGVYTLIISTSDGANSARLVKQ